MFLVELVTAEATLAYFVSLRVLENKDLAFVPASVNVRLARPMTTFATLPLRTLLGQCGLEMTGRLEVLIYIFVTGLAGVRT